MPRTTVEMVAMRIFRPWKTGHTPVVAMVVVRLSGTLLAQPRISIFHVTEQNLDGEPVWPFPLISGISRRSISRGAVCDLEITGRGHRSRGISLREIRRYRNEI